MSFLEMGGYAAYVWPAFGIGALVLIVLLILSLRRLAIHEATVRRLEAGGGGRRRRRDHAEAGVDGEART